jgi:hypothetical protein
MMKHLMVNPINPDVSNNRSLRKVSMDTINRNGITYTLQPSTKDDGTIPNFPFNVPKEDMSANLIFQMIDDQKEREGNKKTHRKRDKGRCWSRCRSKPEVE